MFERKHAFVFAVTGVTTVLATPRHRSTLFDPRRGIAGVLYFFTENPEGYKTDSLMQVVKYLTVRPPTPPRKLVIV